MATWIFTVIIGQVVTCDPERVYGRQQLTVDSGITDAFASPHTLVFARTGKTLTVHVDGTEVGSLTAEPPTDPSLFTSAPLRFNAGSWDARGLNLAMKFTAVDIRYFAKNLGRDLKLSSIWDGGGYFAAPHNGNRNEFRHSNT